MTDIDIELIGLLKDLIEISHKDEIKEMYHNEISKILNPQMTVNKVPDDSYFEVN